jgi:hypothetical protein
MRYTAEASLRLDSPSNDATPPQWGNINLSCPLTGKGFHPGGPPDSPETRGGSQALFSSSPWRVGAIEEARGPHAGSDVVSTSMDTIRAGTVQSFRSIAERLA